MKGQTGSARSGDRGGQYEIAVDFPDIAIQRHDTVGIGVQRWAVGGARYHDPETSKSTNTIDQRLRRDDADAWKCRAGVPCQKRCVPKCSNRPIRLRSGSIGEDTKIIDLISGHTC